MKLKTLALLVFTGFLALTVNAQSLPKNQNSEAITAFRLYKEVNNLQLVTPTVVELPFSNDLLERFDFAVLDKNTNTFEPYFFQQKNMINATPVSISTNPSTNNASMMNDNNTKTYTDFVLPDNTQGNVKITLSSNKEITSSALTVVLGNNVSLPNYVEIRAQVAGENRIVVASKRMDGQTINFPQTTSNRWTITFLFGQPLRISELRLKQDDYTQTNSQSLRFLAQPGHNYKVYFEPDRLANIKVGEAGNLVSAEEVFVLSPALSQNNPAYVIADIDGDKIPDIRDNCVEIANFDQQDINMNGRGDVCDDFDKDGISNEKDNCQNNPNRNQADIDSDGIGDVCDTEESRITERNAWLPWAGIAFACVVLVVLLILTARSKNN